MESISKELLMFTIGGQWMIIILLGIFMAYLWIRQGMNERKTDNLEDEIRRNFDLDEHQESRINNIDSKTEDKSL